MVFWEEPSLSPPQSFCLKQRSHFQVPGEMLSSLGGKSSFVVGVCWVVSYQWLGARAVVCLPAVLGNGHQGRCEGLMVKGGVQHFFRAVPVGEVALPVLPWPSVLGSHWETVLLQRVKFHEASEEGSA